MSGDLGGGGGGGRGVINGNGRYWGYNGMEVSADGPFSCRLCEAQPTTAARAPHPTQGLPSSLASLTSVLPQIWGVVFSLSLSPFPALHFLLFSLSSLSSTLWTSPAASPGVQLGFKLVKNNTDVIRKLHFSPNSILFSSQLSMLLFPSCSVFSLSVMHIQTFLLTHTQTSYCSVPAWPCRREAKEHLWKFWLGKNK